jgi:transcriptional antiterminator
MLAELIKANAPKGADDLALDLHLTPREVNYGLKGIKQWLLYHDIELDIRPGVGISIPCTAEQSEVLMRDLESNNNIQLVLSAEERQQLLALILLVEEDPKHLVDLEQLIQVSRTTVIKDLDAVETWFNREGVTITRRPNYGIEVVAAEDLRQKMISMLLWGATPFGKSLVEINHTEGLVFALENDSEQSPIVRETNRILQNWKMGRVFGQIAYAEAQLNGRFTDDAFLHLALIFAIQTDRIAHGFHLTMPEERIKNLRSLPVWRVAKGVAERLGWDMRPPWRNVDIAGIAIWLLAAPHNENMPFDLSLDPSLDGLVDDLMSQIALFYKSPEMGNDLILRDGLSNHVIPACLRQKFDLWHPFPYPNYSLSDKYVAEHAIAQQLADLIKGRTTYQMPDVEINNIAALLRAAQIRLRPQYFQQVLVVCPGGMASAQLLMSRLEARFPRLGPLKVISMRELTDEQIQPADLIITTVPLGEEISEKIPVILVHPLLRSDDVETIMQFIA